MTEVGGSVDQSYIAPAPVDQSQGQVTDGGVTVIGVSTEVIDGGETIIDGGSSESIIDGGIVGVDAGQVVGVDAGQVVGVAAGQVIGGGGGQVVETVQPDQDYTVPQVGAFSGVWRAERKRGFESVKRNEILLLLGKLPAVLKCQQNRSLTV